MIEVKIIKKKAKFKRNPITNFLFSIEDLICSKCGSKIENDTYCFLCSDHNKIWHEICLDDNHTRTTWVEIGEVKHHYDDLCLIRYVKKEIFDNFEIVPIKLSI